MDEEDPAAERSFGAGALFSDGFDPRAFGDGGPAGSGTDGHFEQSDRIQFLLF